LINFNITIVLIDFLILLLSKVLL